MGSLKDIVKVMSVKNGKLKENLLGCVMLTHELETQHQEESEQMEKDIEELRVKNEGYRNLLSIEFDNYKDGEAIEA